MGGQVRLRWSGALADGTAFAAERELSFVVNAEGSAVVMPAAMCVGGELAAARRARSSAWLPGAGPELHIA